MKPVPKHNFPINIQHYVWEVDEREYLFYEGIYEVILNSHVSITFVPEINRSINQLISGILDIEHAHDQSEARLVAVAKSIYSVTPNESLADHEEVFSLSHLNSVDQVVFYVSHQNFETFHQELSLLDREIGRASHSRNILELREFEFAKFILERVIRSKYFQKADLVILGR